MNSRDLLRPGKNTYLNIELTLNFLSDTGIVLAILVQSGYINATFWLAV